MLCDSLAGDPLAGDLLAGDPLVGDPLASYKWRGYKLLVCGLAARRHCSQPYALGYG